MKLVVSFTNLGPYHLARLRALAEMARNRGGKVLAIETAAEERLYPWRTKRWLEPFDWVTLFPDKALEDLNASECAQAMEETLDRESPTAVAVAGYVRPEVMAASRWARRNGRPAILMSESQEIDRPRTWWKEVIKRQRVRRFSSALVGGPSHRAYLERLGMPSHRITLGYNAVDNSHYQARAQAARCAPRQSFGIPATNYFLSVCRFAPEKNLERLVEAYAIYRRTCQGSKPWDLVLCGSGPLQASLEHQIERLGISDSVHLPGFLQSDALAPWYAHASAFVLASLSEPWGLVVNEAAACGLPLLVSERAGASGTLVVESETGTGRRFHPERVDALVERLNWIARLDETQRQTMGQRAQALAQQWGPERFALGFFEALAAAELNFFKARRTDSILAGSASAG